VKVLSPFEKGLCRRLRARRESMDLTQAQIGERVGLTNVRISHYEKGHRQPSLENLVKLAEAHECSTDYLLGVE
jgi:transcriptional regulator with XRE-family HTH domain